ncbi:MAG: hypothetical protein GY787_29000 [Alteromonadales bacterium]|nr:hypothetical protein [Alteromonadales bacterium]
MEELIETDCFKSKPSIVAKDFVDYFNLEYGLYPAEDFEDEEESPFIESDFTFIGFYLSESGQETMYWAVKNRINIYGVALPLTNGRAIVSISTVKPDSLKAINVG